MSICGIDPGNKGAICVLGPEDPAHISFLDLHKHTAYEAAKWLHLKNVESIWIEDVHSFPGISAKGNFGFGRSVGVALTIAEIATKGELFINTVTPKIWQKYIGVTAKGKEIKTDVAKLARGIYPDAQIYGNRGGLLDGRSDALMIAHYGANNKG